MKKRAVLIDQKLHVNKQPIQAVAQNADIIQAIDNMALQTCGLYLKGIVVNEPTNLSAKMFISILFLSEKWK